MTGDGTLKTITDITTVHTASAVHGIGADTIHHIGVHGATVHGTTEAGTEATGTTPAGMTLGTTIHGTTTRGTTADTMEDGTVITTHGITEATTAGTIHGTITTTTTTAGTTHTTIHLMALVILPSEAEDTKTDTTARELIQTVHRSEKTTAQSLEHKAPRPQEHRQLYAEASERAAAQAETLLYHAVHRHQDLPALHAVVRLHIEDLLLRHQVHHPLHHQVRISKAADQDIAEALEAHITVRPAAATKEAAEATVAEASAEAAVRLQAADIAEAVHQEVIDVN